MTTVKNSCVGMMRERLECINMEQVSCPHCGRILVLRQELIAPFIVRINGALQCSVCKRVITEREIINGKLE